MKSGLWHDVLDEKDIELLMKAYGGFHDSCIKEMRFSGNSCVGENLGMSMSDAALLRVVFQRQWTDPSVNEMEFVGVNNLRLGVSDDYFPVIFDATLLFKNNLVYWANYRGWQPDNPVEHPGTVWISAKSLRWRILEGALGHTPVYYNSFDMDDE